MVIVILERPTGNGKKSQLLYRLLASHRSRKQNPPSQNSTPNIKHCVSPKDPLGFLGPLSVPLQRLYVHH